MSELRVLEPVEVRLIDRVDIITERDGGLIEAYVPVDLICQEEVAVDREHVAELADSIQKESAEHNNLGQLTPVLLGQIEGDDQLHIIDGFHRVPALALLGKDTVYGTIKLGCQWEDIVDLRIVTAKAHKSVKFSRIVEWVEEAWSRTGWASSVNVSQAFQITFLNSSGSRSGLTKEDVVAIRDWVNEKSEQWGISPTYIDRFLRTARLADPELVKSVRDSRRGHKFDVLTPAHLTQIVRYLPNQYDRQRLVAQAVIDDNLPIPQAKALALAVSRTDDPEVIQEYIGSKVWLRMESASKAVTRKRYADIDPNSPEQFTSVLVEKFFDDQVAIAQLLIENAILTGAYAPQEDTSSNRINTLLLTSDIELTNGSDMTEGEIVPWEPEAIEAISRKILDLGPYMIRLIARKYGLGKEDSEDVYSQASIKLLTRVSDGRLPREYEEDLHFRKLVSRFVGYTAIDHIRSVRGRHGQRHNEISIDAEPADGLPLRDRLAEKEDALVEDQDDVSSDFMKSVMPYLNERERRAFVLKGHFGLTSFEMAQVLGTTVGTVNQTIAQYKKRIRDLSDFKQLESVDSS